MISVQEARALIMQNQILGSIENVSLELAQQRVLARDIQSPIHLPLFNNSAMDGFAVRAYDTELATHANPVQLKCVEEIWAGKDPQKTIQPGECAQIMTGARMPKGADAVVMKEKVEFKNDLLKLEAAVCLDNNVRKKGEEILPKQTVMKKGVQLNPAAIAFIAGLGVAEVSVYARPKVSLISTGTELVKPGQVVSGAQIYESNSFGLLAALKALGCEIVMNVSVVDDPYLIQKQLEKALSSSTHVLLSGGVSVGEHDHNKSVLNDCQVKELFWKVAQKPGKPLYVGVKEKTLVFGLPGNPYSALFCYYEYVHAALRLFMGVNSEKAFLNSSQAHLQEPLKKQAGRAHYLKGQAWLEDGQLKVQPTKDQGSHMMGSFAVANCFIVFDQEATEIKQGAKATIQWLPFGEDL